MNCMWGLFFILKMKTLTSITLLLLVFTQIANGQKLDQKTIDQKLDLQNKDNVLYVVNGIPCERSELDSVLNIYPEELLVELMKVKNLGDFPHMTSKEVVLVLFAYQQKKKEIRKTLRNLKTKFPDKYPNASQAILLDSKNPVLYIDNQQIHHTEAKEKFDELKVADIYYIDFKNEPQNPEHYGPNAKNGLVRIWTKNLTE